MSILKIGFTKCQLKIYFVFLYPHESQRLSSQILPTRASDNNLTPKFTFIDRTNVKRPKNYIQTTPI